MLKLICGPSGSGKTDALIECIRQDIAKETRCFLLVPEQQAYISERDLPSRLPQNAGLYFEVVNFSGLADDVFRVFGGVARASASTGLSALLMWDTLRTLAPLLTQYGKTRAVDGMLTSLMLSTVAELRAGGITPTDLERAAADVTTDERLAGKLSDIALIDATYRAKLEETFGGDPADKLERLAQTLEEHAFFADCNVYVDSFTSFTSPEYAILSALLRQARSVTVTLCSDTFSSKLPHFESICQTEKRLSGLAARANCKVERVLLSPKKEDKPTELEILARDIWSFSVRDADRTPIPEKDRDTVRLIAANNLYEEAEAAALYICELVQGGMRYRDIAVIVRDAETYRGVLDAALERHGIPYFLSERTDLSAKPLSRLILCALRSAAHGYRQADVIALLKTGLCGIDMRDAAMFEEYCETWHISGKRFCEEVWSMNPDGLTTTVSDRAREILKAANAVRTAIIPPLVRLSAALTAASTMREFCEAIYDYLLSVDVPARLSSLAKEELSLGQRREAAETVRLYAHLTELLTTLCRLLPNTTMCTDEFIAALSLLLSKTDLGSVPNVQDCVVIGSASMLRVENVRASLLLGLCEGEFPAAVTDDGVFTDSDKEFLEGFDLFFASQTKLRNSEELFYVYRAIAKPSERLFLSTVLQQTDGSARTPSLAFNRARFLLDKKAEVFDMSEIRRALTQAVQKEAHAALSAPPATAPVDLYLSQTNITAFVRCPYLYYLKYVLALREPQDSTPSYLDDGTFLHYVFEKFLRASLGPDQKLRIPEEDEIESLADRIITQYLREIFPDSSEWLGERLLHQFARLRHLATLMLRDILAEIRASSFVPAEFEKGIGKRESDSLPAVTIRLRDGSTVHLTGKIDRIDVYETDGCRYVRVVDYKTGEHKFSPEDVETGSDIQLVLYLYAYLCAYPKTEAYGAQYLYSANVKGVPTIERSGFYFNDDTLTHAADQTEHALYTQSLDGKTAEEIAQLQCTMKDTVTAIAERILSGEAQKTPSESACKNCPIRGNCDRAYHKGKE